MYKSFELNDKGELVLKDKKIIEAQKGIMGEIMKKNSFGILLGGKFSLPARIFEPKTNLEKLTEFFGNLDYLHKA